MDWLNRHAPERAARVIAAVRETRGGRMYEPGLGVRQRGRGPRAEQIAATFDVFARRCGFDTSPRSMAQGAFRRPATDGQMNLRDP